jgi:hypothetical protein
LYSDYAQPIGGPDEMRMRDWIARAGPIASLGPRTFALQSVAKRERVRFEICGGAERQPYRVEEIGRETSQIRFDSPIDDGAEEAQLETVGVLRLDDAASPGISVLDDVLVDPTGRIVIVDAATQLVSVFDANGKLSYRTALDRDDLVARGGWGKIALADDGSVLLAIREGWMRIDPQGRIVGRESREQGIFPAHVLARRGLADYWRFGSGHRIDFSQSAADARKVGPWIDKRPDGRWLQGIVGGVVGRDGTLAVIDAAGTSATGFVPSALCTYGSDGSPLETIGLSDMRGMPKVAILDRWIVVEDRLGLRFFERGGNCRLFRRLDAAIGSEAWASPDGSELWMVDLQRMLVTRFAVR